MSIDEYLRDFPPEVLAAVRRFQQGDVLERPPFAYFANGQHPLWALSETARTTGEPALVELAAEDGFPFGVITTQTCDIVEEDSQVPRKPWIQVAPVYELADVKPMRRASIEAYSSADFVHLSGAAFTGAYYVADLRIGIPIEKSLLIGRDPIPGFADEVDRESFGRHCAAYLDRPVVSGLVHDHIVKYMRRYFERRKKLRGEPARAGVRELRLKVGGSQDAPVVQLIVVTASTDADSKKIAEDCFGAWWDLARKNAEGDPIEILGNNYTTLAELSAEEYVASVPLRLDLITD